MRVIRFSCRNLNSFLNREIIFFPDVSFLHGINGSGKTTILRALASMLTPDPIWLLSATYDHIEVSLEHNNQEITIHAFKGESSALTIRISEPINLEDTISNDDIRLFGKFAEEELYRPLDPDEISHRVRALSENVKTFAFIQSIPTPIFLGLDRTTLTPAQAIRSTRTVSRQRTVQTYFRTQLDDAIAEADRLLARQLSLLSNERNKIFEELRNQFVLSLFVIPEKQETMNLLSMQKLNEWVEKFEAMRTPVLYALQRIDIGESAIKSLVEPFFADITRIANAARQAQKDFEKSRDREGATQTFISGISPLLNLTPSISIIERTLTKIEEANRSEKILSRPLETYQRIMETFFSDSRKALVFEENAVRVRLPSGKNGDLTSLSSGERQIFVLITHLIFNPAVRRENLLLIDEPELSLHLKWQRQFVTAVREASPSTQMILATHSPEIIYDRDDRLIELTIGD